MEAVNMSIPKKAVFERLKEELRCRIEKDELSSGMMLPSEHSLCRSYKISRPSVRKALAALENTGLIYRVPGKGSYVGTRRQEQPRWQFNIGVDIDCSNTSGTELLNGMFSRCGTGIARLVWVDVNNLQCFDGKYFDGLILTHKRSLDTGGELARCGIPVVAVKHLPDEPLMAYVGVDYAREAEKAVNCLMSMGHRQIGMLCRSGDPAGDLCRHGFELSIYRQGLTVAPDHILQCSSRENMVREIRAFLGRTRCSAVFVVDELTMFELFCVCKIEGINIPRDLSVICFEDTTAVSRRFETGISEIRVPTARMGELAVDYIINRLVTRDDGRVMRTILPAEIVLRDSCRAVMRH